MKYVVLYAHIFKKSYFEFLQGVKDFFPPLIWNKVFLMMWGCISCPLCSTWEQNGGSCVEGSSSGPERRLGVGCVLSWNRTPLFEAADSAWASQQITSVPLASKVGCIHFRSKVPEKNLKCIFSKMHFQIKVPSFWWMNRNWKWKA